VATKLITVILRNFMAKDARKLVTLECEKCKTRGYHTDKRLKGQDVIKRIELLKYCNVCKARTLHKETK
jgi:ribosomal protein L33